MTQPLTPAQRDLAAVHHHLAQHAALTAKRRWPTAHYDDLLSDAYLGLLDAAQRYQPHLASFTTYATPRIKGAIIDGWRQRNGRDGHRMLHLLPEYDGQLIERYLAEDDLGFDRIEDAVHAAATIASLDISDRNLAVLVELGTGRTLRDVADEFGITESRVSQIRSFAYQRLPMNAYRRQCLECGKVLTGLARRYDTDRCRKRAYHERRLLGIAS